MSRYAGLENDSYLRFKVPTKLKNDFQAITKKNMVNMSEFFRQAMEKYVLEHESQKDD